MKRSSRFLLWIFLAGLALENRALACRSANGFPIFFSREMARGYGAINALLLAGAFYLQVRRCGFRKSTFLWPVIAVGVYLFNPGWHYSGQHGDCGTGEADDAHQMMFYITGLFVYQVAAAIGFLWKKSGNNDMQPVEKPPIAFP